MSIHQNSWQLADILAIYESLPLDIMLIEGYKMNIIRRLSLRTAQDQVLLQQVTNILCVIFGQAVRLIYPLQSLLFRFMKNHNIWNFC